MKKILISLLTLIVVFTGCQNQKDSFKSVSSMISLEEGFIDPPVSVRPKGYWAWINGNIDTSQLTFELEEAKAKGMAGFDILDVGAVSNPGGIVPAGPEFMGEECLEAIGHAVQEATRLLSSDERFTKTNITRSNWQEQITWKDAPLLESGLIGPVSIQYFNKL